MSTDPNPWELYDSHPDFIIATAAIEAAWDEAIRLAPELPSAERAALAERHVARALHRFRHVGACDSEPFHHLRRRLRQHFGYDGY